MRFLLSLIFEEDYVQKANEILSNLMTRKVELSSKTFLVLLLSFCCGNLMHLYSEQTANLGQTFT